MAFVHVTGLSKSFGDLAAVDGASFSVEAGHTLALLGPSGCGKTTILRCLAGLENADSGVIEIAGRKVFDSVAGVNLKPEQRDLGVVFQSYAVWPHMTVAENVAFPLRVRRCRRAERTARTNRIIDLVGLGDVRDKPATALSGGQQQRVALARALVHEPSLVLFDEPMSNLDARLRARMRMELAVLQKKLGFTAIYVTHDHAEAFALAEIVVVMNQGRIEAAGGPRDVFARPQTSFVAEFLGFNINRGKAVDVRPQDDGFRVEVALADGFRMWGVQRGEKPVRPGHDVLACSRKECIAVNKLNPVEPHRAVNGLLDNGQTFFGVIQAASFLGLDEEYLVSIFNRDGRYDPNGVGIGAVQRACGLRAGEYVAVTVRPEDVIVFADENGDASA